MYTEDELVVLPRGVPARIVVIDTDSTAPSRRDEVQLLFVVHGSPRVIVDDIEGMLETEDVLLVNARSLLQIEADRPVQLLALRFDLHRIDPSLDEVAFRVNSSATNNPKIYQVLLHYMARIVKTNGTQDDQARFLTMALLYAMVDELTRRFIADPNDSQPTSDKHRSRLRSLLRFIDEHYAESLTLNQVAAHEHLSAPYLSAFFKEHVGMTFSEYYNKLRLDRAVDDLVSTDESVEAVARRNGFRDPRAFVKLFKQRHDMLPSQFRRADNAERTDRQPWGGIETVPDTPLRLLAKFLPNPVSGTVDAAHDVEPPTRVVVVEDVSVTGQHRDLSHAYRKITTVGRAKELLYEEVRDMLRQWQHDVGFEYVKFHGLFADDMHVYRKGQNGRPCYSFVLVDKVLDFLLSLKLRPFIEFSFMPQDLASIPERTVYSAPFNVSPPKNIDAWTELVTAFMGHVIERYSFAEVSQWLFCVWNEPDTGPTLFGFDDDAEFHNFYAETYQAVKSFGQELQFGSPAMLVSYAQNKDWLLRFLDYTEEKLCFPDFLNIHFYDNDFVWDSLPEHTPGHPSSSRLNKDQDTFRKTLSQLKLLLQDHGLEFPIYLTEWNLTVSHRDLLNDTTFKSCYLAKNLLESYDAIDSFGYWTLTDFIEELQPSEEVFHGGLGLFTYNGIKKPHYHFFAALSRIGDRLLAAGEGYFVTASDQGVQIFLYNYEHFSHLFASGERFDTTYLERYAPFADLGRMDFSLDISDLAPGKYRLREHVINAEHGSAFDTWLRMGAPDIDADCVDYIRQVSVPQMIVNDVEVDGTTTISAVLEPLEVRVLELNRVVTPT